MSKKPNEHCSMDKNIDGIRMSESDRQIARAHMHDADVVAGFCGLVFEALRSSRKALAATIVARAR